MDKFDNKYRIESARLKNWDYGSNTYYFITICTAGRECFFGEKVDTIIELNEIGKIVKREWLKTPYLRPDMNLKMGEFIVMPNHFHAIIYIGENQYNSILDSHGNVVYGVASIKRKENRFGPQTKNLASIIRGFKSSVTKQSRQIIPEFAWQPRFHDHIIRNKKEWYAVTNYIKNNPKNWRKDDFNTNIS